MNKKYVDTSFSILQWFVFLLANAIALPIIIGGIFHLSIEDISTLMQRTFLVVGVSSFIQAWFGHRYPIADGPAGSWVSIFVILGQVAMHQGQSAKDVLQLLEGGLIIAGILLFVLWYNRACSSNSTFIYTLGYRNFSFNIISSA